MDFSFQSPYYSQLSFLPKYFLSSFHPLGLRRKGSTLVQLGFLIAMDILHLPSSGRFVTGYFGWFSQWIFDFRMVAWQISSDTNDFVVFSEVLHTSSVPLLFKEGGY